MVTQIVVKHTEKWPSHNFGDRVQATDYKITGLKYYLGTIQRRNNKTKEIDYVTYQIKFDDGEVINNILLKKDPTTNSSPNGPVNLPPCAPQTS